MKNNTKQTQEKNAVDITDTSKETDDNSNDTLETVNSADTEIRLKSLEEKVADIITNLSEVSGLLKELNQARLTEVFSQSEEDAQDENKYASIRDSILKELSPYVDMISDYNNKCERDNALKAMMLTEEMSDAFDVADELDDVVECYPALKNSTDAMEKYVTAYVILKGKSAINNSNPDADGIIKLIEDNPDLKKAVIFKIKEEFKNTRTQPKLDFEGGISTLNIPEKPKNMSDAKKASFKLFK